MSRLSLDQSVPPKYDQAQIKALFQVLQQQINALSEGRMAARYFTATSAPTTGDFAVGDIVWNSAPTAAGTFCWVCITASSPGPVAFKTVVISA